MSKRDGLSIDQIATAIGLSAPELRIANVVASAMRITPAAAIGRLVQLSISGRDGADLVNLDRSADVAVERLAILRRWLIASPNRKPTRESTASFVGNYNLRSENRISVATLYLWRRRYQLSGLSGLLDGRKNRPSSEPTPFVVEVRRLWLANPSLSISECHRLALTIAKKNGWAPRALKNSIRFVKAGGPRVQPVSKLVQRSIEQPSKRRRR